LLVESNLVSATPTWISAGQPFHPDVAWSFSRVILSRIFEQIDSLDELFGLKDTGSRWIDRMAALTMRRTAKRLRDLCMAEMYARVTVNGAILPRASSWASSRREKSNREGALPRAFLFNHQAGAAGGGPSSSFFHQRSRNL
jgi:hypothetical protein